MKPSIGPITLADEGHGHTPVCPEAPAHLLGPGNPRLVTSTSGSQGLHWCSRLVGWHTRGPEGARSQLRIKTKVPWIPLGQLYPTEHIAATPITPPPRATCQAVKPAPELKSFLGEYLEQNLPGPITSRDLDSGWAVCRGLTLASLLAL